MANVEHSTLTTTNLHENKGVSTATDSTVATASGGTTVWQKLTASNLTGTGNSFGAQLLHIQDFSSRAGIGNSWTTLVLTSVITNEISGSSLGSNTITLPAGTYFIEAYTGAQSNLTTGGVCQIKVFNSSDSADLFWGITGEAINGAGILLQVRGRFTLAGTKNIQIQMRAPSGTVNSGVLNSIPSGREVYRDVMIWKIA